MKIVIHENVKLYLEYHAIKNKGQEIYGWLIGYEKVGKKRELHVVAAYSAHDYLRQTLINAEPNPNEIAAIEEYLPIGLSNLGQYHSHPEKVYHSATDDKTLLEMAQVYPNVISLVTNGDVTKVYCVENDKVIEADLKTTDKLLDMHLLEVEIPMQLDSTISRPKNAMEVESQLKEQLKNFKPGDGFKPISVGKGGMSVPFICTVPYVVDSMDMIKNYITNIAYNSLISKTEGDISPDLVYYQDLPLNITASSFARSTAKQRAALLEETGYAREADRWRRIATS
ncbi:MAG: Mov34/MPN/PAD-1 family protein [Candidatus Heimdallarchaeota archaeon]|nr:Mov34/MPN/PAD-1 family protein [Candidatus Heimdallarchaeota archaeon]